MNLSHAIFSLPNLKIQVGKKQFNIEKILTVNAAEKFNENSHHPTEIFNEKNRCKNCNNGKFTGKKSLTETGNIW